MAILTEGDGVSAVVEVVNAKPAAAVTRQVPRLSRGRRRR